MPITSAPDQVLWASFAYQNDRPDAVGVLTLFFGQSEIAYFGRVNNGIFGSGSAFEDAALTPPLRDIQALGVSTADLHTYLIKITGMGNQILRFDVWVDYSGTSVPLADFDAEPTYAYTAYRPSSGGVTKLRINGEGDGTKASKFDALRFSSVFF